MAPDRSLLWASARTLKRGPKPRMTLERIVDAAIGLADAEGLAAVSMQRVADELGATKMSLYRYVPGKAELTALMLDKRLGAPGAAGTPGAGASGTSSGPATGWRAGLGEWTSEIHRRFADAPWTLELAVGARVIGPNELAWTERGLAALSGTPLSGAERLDVLALLSGHARSMVQQQIATGRPERAIALLLAEIVAEHAASFPHVAAAFEDTSREGDRDDALAFGTARILDGIEALIRSRTPA